MHCHRGAKLEFHKCCGIITLSSVLQATCVGLHVEPVVWCVKSVIISNFCVCLCVSREVGRHLLRFVRLFISRSHYQLTQSSVRHAGPRGVSPSAGRVGSSGFVDGDLVRCIFTKINRVESVQSYNLPSLELTLLALMHLTARSFTVYFSVGHFILVLVYNHTKKHHESTPVALIILPDGR